MNQTQQPPWLLNNLLLCYDRETHAWNDSERKHHFLQHKKNTITTRKPSRMGQRAREGS